MSLKRAIQIDKADTHLRTTDDLLQAGLINAEEFAEVDEIAQEYDISITPEMVRLIETKNDPIALQFVPDAREKNVLPQENLDPISDYPKSPLKALVHRYRNRVLFKPTSVCAVYCRFCFRREMVGPEGDVVSQQDIDDAIKYIAEHREITEVVFSGGDPLMLSPKKIKTILQKIDAIPHIRWVRFHTRIPVVSPGKINEELIDSLTISKPVLMAIHTNHAREITPPQTRAALLRMIKAGIVLLGQSVLLKGINDTVDAMSELLETMMENRIKPYYVHHTNLVTTGTNHFRVSFEDGMALMNQLRLRVSGVCIPNYMLEIPGAASKVAINPHSVRPVANQPGHYIFRDVTGKEFHHP